MVFVTYFSYIVPIPNLDCENAFDPYTKLPATVQEKYRVALKDNIKISIIDCFSSKPVGEENCKVATLYHLCLQDGFYQAVGQFSIYSIFLF